MSSRESDLSSIDWSEVRARIKSAADRLSPLVELDEAETRRILHSRAVDLARIPAAQPAGESIEVVQFAIGDDTYAIENRFVREVSAASTLTAIPSTGPPILGIMNLRGEIMAVLDLKSLLHGSHFPENAMSMAVVLEQGEMYFALAADAVAGVRRLFLKDITASSPTFGPGYGKYVIGVTHDRTIVINGAALIGEEALIVREQVD